MKKGAFSAPLQSSCCISVKTHSQFLASEMNFLDRAVAIFDDAVLRIVLARDDRRRDGDLNASANDVDLDLIPLSFPGQFIGPRVQLSSVQFASG